MNPKQLTNDELVHRLKIASDDCAIASRSKNNSEWHASCFAALMVLAFEAQDRGIDFRVLH